MNPAVAGAAAGAAAGLSPATLALLKVLGAGLTGAGMAYKANQDIRAQKGVTRETKRRTMAELLNAALMREFEGGEQAKKRRSDLATQRAQAMQNVASQYVQALR